MNTFEILLTTCGGCLWVVGVLLVFVCWLAKRYVPANKIYKDDGGDEGKLRMQ